MKHLFTGLFVLVAISVFGQSIRTQWQPVSSEGLRSAMDPELGIPATSKFFEINFEELKIQLTSLPANDMDVFQIALPLDDGTVVNFEAIHSSVMMPGLQAQFPEIRTFRGQAVDRPQLTARFGISPHGFYAIFDEQGREFLIQAIEKDNLTQYAVFDLLSGMTVEDQLQRIVCGTEDNHTAPHEANGTLSLLSTEKRMRHLKLGIACTSSFAADVGPGESAVMAKIVQVVNQVNQRYNLDLGMHFDLIDKTPLLLNLDADTDFFTIQNNGGQLLGPSQEFFNLKLSTSDYDFGQTWTTSCTDVGGVVNGRACNNFTKARGVSCGPRNVTYFLQTVKHEMGHQFSASHTFGSCNGSTQLATQGAYEPGSGSTIMSYAGGCGPDNITGSADDYFHIASILHMESHLASAPGCGTYADGINNTPDAVLPTYQSEKLTIPYKTPYELVGDATDPDNDNLTYNWEQFDASSGEPLGTNFIKGPLSRSFKPAANGNIRLIPRLNNLISGTYDISDRLPEATREMNWRFNVRDNNPIAGSTISKLFTFNVDSTAGPFKVTFPGTNTDTIFRQGQYVEIFWDVANTDKAPVNCQTVDIFFSTNGEVNFSDTLVLNTPNDGREWVMLPSTGTNTRFKIKASGNIFLDISKKAIRTIAPTDPGYSYDVYPHNALLCPAEAKIFEIKSIQWKDFTTPFTLEAVDGWPEGTVLNFDKTTIVPGESASLTVDTRDVNDAGFYTIRLRAVSPDFDTIWRYIDVEILPATLDFQAVISPLQGSQNTQQVPRFEWVPVVGTDQYEFELAENPLFAPENIIDTYTGNLPAFNTLEILEPGKVYFWRVRSSNRCYAGPWSQINTFQTILFECNTISGLGLPKSISPNTLTPPIEVKFNVANEGGITADVNVKNINISHGDISNLEITAMSPSGSEVLLFGNRCFSFGNMKVSFDDEAPLNIDCSRIFQNNTFKPIEPLSKFIGENVNGSWSVLVKTVKGGSSGVVNSIDFNLCASVTATPIVKINNNLFHVKSGFEQVLENVDLKYTSDNTDDNSIAYIVLQAPKYGVLKSWGQELRVGEIFYQSFLNAWAISYEPFDDQYEGADNFVFAVKDDKFGYLAPETMNIDINKNNMLFTQSQKEDISSRLFVYPNPTTGDLKVGLFEMKVAEDARLRVMNLEGKEVYRKQLAPGVANTDINITALPAGVYFIQVTSGKFIAQQKLVKI